MHSMTTLTLAASWMGFFRGLFVVLFIFACLLLIGVILLQKGRGGGLSSAFGGAMGSSPFGTKTGDVFTWITVVMAAVFLLSAVVLNLIYVPERAPETTTGQQPQPQSPVRTGEQNGGTEQGAGGPAGETVTDAGGGTAAPADGGQPQGGSDVGPTPPAPDSGAAGGSTDEGSSTGGS